MGTAIRKHWIDFLAIILLVVAAAAVGSYVLGKQRFSLPAWVPVIGTDFFVLKGEFSTAQSVTPGQGQTVNIAGVKVGDITDVRLVNGRAVVTMKMKPKYGARVRRDATMLLRPKTGLNDMVIELTPGSRSQPRVPENWTVPISSSLPNVNPDEVLAALDGDTRDYLKLLLGGAGEGLRGNGRELSATLRRFEPTGRDLARVNSALATRRENIRQVIHSLGTLSTALGAKDDDIAALVDSSNAVFRSFANQEGALRETLRLLPGALEETQGALASTDRLAGDLGPALERLRPGARALGPALRRTRPFLRATTPVIRDEIRPFTRAARPTVAALRPAARDLTAVTPDLTKTFGVVNRLLNTLTYNAPGDADEGYLFWASWANHAGASVFSTQDAHGPIRRGSFLTTCSNLGVLNNAGAVNPVLGVLVQLVNAPSQPKACPTSQGAK